jgi:hypothetical protein
MRRVPGSGLLEGLGSSVADVHPAVTTSTSAMAAAARRAGTDHVAYLVTRAPVQRRPRAAAVQVRARLLEFSRQGLHRRRHGLRGLGLVRVDGVEGLVDLLEGRAERLRADGRVGGDALDLAGLRGEHLRVAADEVLRRAAQGVDLLDDLALVVEGGGEHHGDAQRGDGRGGRPVDALDQLVVVAPDHVHRQIALGAHRELGEQVLVLLPDREEDVRAQGVRLGRVLRLHARDVALYRRVQGLRQDHVLLELAHRVPEADAFGLQRGVVAAQFVLAAAERADDSVQRALRGGVLGDMVAELVAAGEPGQQLAGLAAGQVARVQVLDGATQFD